jgi:hypothetical protein
MHEPRHELRIHPPGGVGEYFGNGGLIYRSPGHYAGGSRSFSLRSLRLERFQCWTSSAATPKALTLDHSERQNTTTADIVFEYDY